MHSVMGQTVQQEITKSQNTKLWERIEQRFERERERERERHREREKNDGSEARYRLIDNPNNYN